ncbi:nagb/rpia/CoA transferase-like protein [Polyplosphaeria fusca]|uniref:Nagb/rpia/CoA transferase-like protein n=1 Tax=Polyplosphaeria fusca TaxID=682080 RepID=A0A9P4R4Z7_9PLEO|nr:nagb/rpia/CoA transferase-like protein [Polyplosphaeria fusca]
MVFSMDSSERRKIEDIHYNKSYEVELIYAINALQTDYQSGARELANNAVEYLRVVILAAWPGPRSIDEWWTLSIEAAKKLIEARPAMSVAMKAALVHALEEIALGWHIDSRMADFMNDTRPDKKGVKGTDLADTVNMKLDQVLKERKEVTQKLAQGFATWMETSHRTNRNPDHPIKILTLSNSSTIRASLFAFLTKTSLPISLTILESRPRCEGVDLANQLLASLTPTQQSNISILVAPDAAIGTLMPGKDCVLLGADGIAGSGWTSNKTGSAAAAMLGYLHGVPVWVLSESDKIVAAGEDGEARSSGGESHPAEELAGAWSSGGKGVVLMRNVEVYGHWFEDVDPKYITGWYTELGEMGREQIREVSAETWTRYKAVFGD